MENKPKPYVIDWGDPDLKGPPIKVTPPDLSHLEAVICPSPCFPEGEEGTGQVIYPPTPEVYSD